MAAGLPAASVRTRLEAEGIPQLSGHVIILGFGVGGQLVARALRDLSVPYLILELNGATVAAREGRRRADLLWRRDQPREPRTPPASNGRSRLVSLLSDPDAALRMVKTVRELDPICRIIVRTRYRLEADRLRAAGATVAVAEELEASLEVLAQLLARLDIPGNVIGRCSMSSGANRSRCAR